MTVACVDTSTLAAIAFGEPGSATLGRRLGTFSVLLSSNLLEAELRAAYSREERRFSQAVVSGIEWILPEANDAHSVAFRRGPWRHCEAVELATLEWVHWYNHRRLFGPLDHVPPAAFEAHYYHKLQGSAMAA